jgi:two-component system, NtrC family, response regulator AtoC
MRHNWPGNVRQLENVVRRFLILPHLEEALAELGNTNAQPPQSRPDRPASTSLKKFARNASDKAAKELVFNTLNEVNWNRKEAARRLNVCYKSLLNKLHRWESSDRDESATWKNSGPDAQVAFVATAGN